LIKQYSTIAAKDETHEMSNPRIMVLGVGNELLSDEGLGIHFLKYLRQGDLPDNVELLEGGTAGMELIGLIQDTDFLIIVDALNANTNPGELFRFKPQDLKIFPEMFTVSFHQVGILDVLTTASILGTVPETIIYGVQPKSLEWGLELSPEITAVLPRLKEYIFKDISHIQDTLQFP